MNIRRTTWMLLPDGTHVSAGRDEDTGKWHAGAIQHPLIEVDATEWDDYGNKEVTGKKMIPDDSAPTEFIPDPAGQKRLDAAMAPPKTSASSVVDET